MLDNKQETFDFHIQLENTETLVSIKNEWGNMTRSSEEFTIIAHGYFCYTLFMVPGLDGDKKVYRYEKSPTFFLNDRTEEDMEDVIFEITMRLM